MLLDAQMIFSGAIQSDGSLDGQAITVDAISTNVIDLRSPSGAPTLVDEGIAGDDVWLNIVVQTAADAADAAKTVIFSLESDSTANLATSATVHWISEAITGANLTAGAVVAAVRLPSARNYERYLGVRYNVSATFTAFKVRAFLTIGRQAAHTYPSGFSLS